MEREGRNLKIFLHFHINGSGGAHGSGIRTIFLKTGSVLCTFLTTMETSVERRGNDEALGATFRNLDCNRDEDFLRSEDGIVYLW